MGMIYLYNYIYLDAYARFSYEAYEGKIIIRIRNGFTLCIKRNKKKTVNLIQLYKYIGSIRCYGNA